MHALGNPFKVFVPGSREGLTALTFWRWISIDFLSGKDGEDVSKYLLISLLSI